MNLDLSGPTLHETSITLGTGTNVNTPDTRTDEEREAAHQRVVEWSEAWRSLTPAQREAIHALPRIERDRVFYRTTAVELLDYVRESGVS